MENNLNEFIHTITSMDDNDIENDESCDIERERLEPPNTRSPRPTTRTSRNPNPQYNQNIFEETIKKQKQAQHNFI